MIGARLIAALLLSCKLSAALNVWINEIHYDNAGADTGEGIELAGVSGLDISGYKLYMYNGADMKVYQTVTINSGLPASADGYSFVFVPVLGLQNGSPDGVALVDSSGAVLQFLSYEGTITAADGAAATTNSLDIGVSESGTVSGSSLQQTQLPVPDGSAGAWISEGAASTFGAINNGQTYPSGQSQAPTPSPDSTPAPTTASPTSVPSPAPSSAPVAVYAIQGASHASPLLGQVVDTQGVVTAKASNGYYLQDPTGDNDPATSDAVFVFTASAPTVSEGDYVTVRGKVTEFGFSGGLKTTEITGATTVVVSSGNALPAPVIIGADGRASPTVVIEDDNLAVFDPATDGIDFYESLEAMLVQITAPRVVGPTNSFGELWVVPASGSSIATPRGGIVARPDVGDYNPERVLVDDAFFLGHMPAFDVGQKLQMVVGVMDYSFSNYNLRAKAVPALSPKSPASPPLIPTYVTGTAYRLSVATMNVENLDISDGPTKFNGLADILVNYLLSPDIVSLEEIQDNNGAAGGASDTTVDATLTIQTFIDAITVAGGPQYNWTTINPIANTNGGEPGGNIRVVFIYQPTRVSFNGYGNATTASTDAVTVSNVGNAPKLSRNPGLIEPTNAAFSNSRKPLVAQFGFRGTPVYLVGCHFNSKGGDGSLYGDVQPPVLSSEVQRLQQATLVNSFVKDILAIKNSARIVVLGDINDFQQTPPLVTLAGTSTLWGGQLNDLLLTLSVNRRYSYVYQGNSEALDHILVSNWIKQNGAVTFEPVHVNAEYSVQRSDHDPLVASFAVA